MPLFAKDLIDGRPHPVCTSAGVRLAEALALMQEHDFSQLPVEEGGKVTGMISREHILTAVTQFGWNIGEAYVRDAMRSATPTEMNADLFQLLERMNLESVVVIADEGKPVGIVTAYDTASFFQNVSKTLLLLQDIEFSLREFILFAFPTSEEERIPLLAEAVAKSLAPSHELKAYTKSLHAYFRHSGTDHQLDQDSVTKAFAGLQSSATSSKGFDDLTLAELITMFLHPDRWHLYSEVVRIQPNGLRLMLDSVRKHRNRVAHFKGALSKAQLDEVVYCWEWFEKYRRPLQSHFNRTEGGPLGDQGPTNANTTRNAQQKRKRRSKYSALAAWLGGVPSEYAYTWASFDKVEQLIGSKLPVSARSSSSWWANNTKTRVQSLQWLSAGFRVSEVDLDREMVRFSRRAVEDR